MSGFPRSRLTRTNGRKLRNPYSQLRRFTRSRSRSLNRNAAKPEYLERIRVIMDKMVEPGAIEIIMSELNEMGHLYFGKHKQPYRDVTYAKDEPIEALTKKEFMERYEEEEGEAYDDEANENEASFSDAFRHATLIDVDTLRVSPGLRRIMVEGPLSKTDYVFTWTMIQSLPAMLEGTRLVAIHIDTEDGGQIFFPLPG
jgi:hypothetical protein